MPTKRDFPTGQNANLFPLTGPNVSVTRDAEPEQLKRKKTEKKQLNIEQHKKTTTNKNNEQTNNHITNDRQTHK